MLLEAQWPNRTGRLVQGDLSLPRRHGYRAIASAGHDEQSITRIAAPYQHSASKQDCTESVHTRRTLSVGSPGFNSASSHCKHHSPRPHAHGDQEVHPSPTAAAAELRKSHTKPDASSITTEKSQERTSHWTSTSDSRLRSAPSAHAHMRHGSSRICRALRPGPGLIAQSNNDSFYETHN